MSAHVDWFSASTERAAAAAEPAPRSGGGAAGAATPVLTGGESHPKTKVDWFTVTFLPESSDLHVAAEIWERFQVWFGYQIVGQECPGRYGYRFGCEFAVIEHGSVVPVGRVDWGGEKFGGRARLDLSGTGCSKVSDWRRVAEFVRRFCPEPSITRIDLALDCLDGQFTVEDARDWYLAGEFHAGGRRPRHSTPGDWLDPHYGRTLEIGRRENGKMLRIYEKGRQLGDPDSPWTRFEVEIRNNHRDIPLEVLDDPDPYFVGAYEALERILDCGGERIRTHQQEGEIVLGRAVHFQRVMFGQVVEVLRAKLSADDVLTLISRPGLPRRLQRSSLVAFNQIGADALLQELRE